VLILAGGSVAVTVVLWPLFAATFGRASVVGPLANIALIPLAGFLMWAGFALWGLNSMVPRAAGPAALLTDFGLGLFEKICRRAAAWPWGTVELRTWTAVELAAYALALVAICSWPRRRRAVILAGISLSVWGCGGLFSRPPALSVAFLSRPPGTALVRFCGGRAWFVGPRPPTLAARKAAAALGAGPIERVVTGRTVRVRLGRTEILIGDPRGPAARTGQGPFAIIGEPRGGWLEAQTDGDSLRVHASSPTGLRLGPPLSQRIQFGRSRRSGQGPSAP
ncbi:MAG: ComEC/Rec2 family competence protein, partial [Elusimicrobiota bacterium]